MNYNYIQNIDSDEPIMLINKHVGWDDKNGMGIDGAKFQEELLALDQMGKKRIQVWINSVGGLVMEGYNICNAILKTKTPVDTYCMGMAASIAGVIFQCGRKRIMADYGILMYHNPYALGTKPGTSPLLDSMKDSLNTIVRTKCGMTQDAVQRMMDRTSFIQADEAKQMGLCDEVEHSVKLNTKYMPKAMADGERFYEAANKVLNKIFDNQTTTNMINVANKLGLNQDAKEESILQAITEVENRATAAEAAKNEAETALNTTKAELETMKAELEKMQNEYNEAKAKLDEQEKENERIANEAKAEKAKNLVEDAIKAGKIKNEALESWTAKASADFDGTKELLESIPTNKTANKIDITGNKAGQKEVYSVAVEMANISNRLENK